jgi:hypothetical protein
MKISKISAISTIGVLCAAILSVASCRSASKSGMGGKASLLSLKTTQKGDVPGGSDPAKLCEYIKANGYFPSDSVAANTKLLFSSSYEVVENSAGQAYGVVGSDGYFVQQGNNTTQLLVCPGASGLSGGRCNWKINGKDGYLQLAYDVVCNKRGRGTSAVHPGYSSQTAKLVSYVASTAGQTVTGQDALEVTLSGGTSKARIVFAKGSGLVATVFQESSSPAGTAEVFIGGQSSGGGGSGGGGGGGGDEFDR